MVARDSTYNSLITCGEKIKQREGEILVETAYILLVAEWSDIQKGFNMGSY